MNTPITKIHGMGKSSFELVNVDLVFQNLFLTSKTIFLDLGCGKGNYTLAAARSMGPQSLVFAIDAWREGLEELERHASDEGLLNIKAIRANLNEQIPLENMTVDVCFMATVFHDLLRESSGRTVLTEIGRVLKPTGQLAIIEFKKIEDGPGPPVSIRLSPEETQKIILPFGFIKDRLIEIGPYNYLLTAFLKGQ